MQPELVLTIRNGIPESVSDEMIPEDVVFGLRGLLMANKMLNDNKHFEVPLGYTTYIHAFFGINPDVQDQGNEIISICHYFEEMTPDDPIEAIKVANQLYTVLIEYRKLKQ